MFLQHLIYIYGIDIKYQLTVYIDTGIWTEWWQCYSLAYPHYS